MTTEQEWLAHLDKLAARDQPTGADIAETLGALLERINTVIIGHINRSHDDSQANTRRIDLLRVAVADLRTIVADLNARMTELEQEQEHEAGDDG